jgi:hypothetical protein
MTIDPHRVLISMFLIRINPIEIFVNKCFVMIIDPKEVLCYKCLLTKVYTTNRSHRGLRCHIGNIWRFHKGKRLSHDVVVRGGQALRSEFFIFLAYFMSFLRTWRSLRFPFRLNSIKWGFLWIFYGYFICMGACEWCLWLISNKMRLFMDILWIFYMHGSLRVMLMINIY